MGCSYSKIKALGALLEDIKFVDGAWRCPSGHTLAEHYASPQNQGGQALFAACNLCARRVDSNAPGFTCRRCDFDMCFMCRLRLKPPAEALASQLSQMALGSPILDHSTGMPLRMDGGISFTSAAVQLSSAVQHAPMQHAPMSALSYSTHRTASAPNMGAVLRAAERQAARAARLVQELQAQASPTTHGDGSLTSSPMPCPGRLRMAPWPGEPERETSTVPSSSARAGRVTDRYTPRESNSVRMHFEHGMQALEEEVVPPGEIPQYMDASTSIKRAAAAAAASEVPPVRMPRGNTTGGSGDMHTPGFYVSFSRRPNLPILVLPSPREDLPLIHHHQHQPHHNYEHVPDGNELPAREEQQTMRILTPTAARQHHLCEEYTLGWTAEGVVVPGLAEITPPVLPQQQQLVT